MGPTNWVHEADWTPTLGTKKTINESCDDCKHFRPQWSVSVNGDSFEDKLFVAVHVVKFFNALVSYPLPAVITLSSADGGSIRYRKNW